MLPIRILTYVMLISFFANNAIFSCTRFDKGFFLDQVDQSSIPDKLCLVDIKENNPTIVVDMKYTTSENYAGKPISAETKCLVSRQVMNKLNNIQAELQQQDLGLKVFEGFRPLYVEVALLRQGSSYKRCNHLFKSFCIEIGLLSYWQNFFYYHVSDWAFLKSCVKPPLRNRGAMVSVTLVTHDGKELVMPTKFDDRSNKSSSCYKDASCCINAHKELLTQVMIKHGFEQSDVWYEFRDKEFWYYPAYLYARHTTATNLTPKQQEDLQIIGEKIMDILIERNFYNADIRS